MYGVARDEEANVICDVHAYPPAERFKWSFNNTSETIDVPDALFKKNGTRSVLTHTPKTEMDYGTVMCWAENVLGQQKEPCVFHIITAGKIGK